VLPFSAPFMVDPLPVNSFFKASCSIPKGAVPIITTVKSISSQAHVFVTLAFEGDFKKC
jgi:hypothetical protein